MAQHNETINVNENFREMKADYRSGRSTRFNSRRRGIPAMGANADYHVRSEPQFLRLMEMARDFDRDDPVVGQGISRLIDNVLQDGMKLDPQTGDEELNNALKSRFAKWGEDSDACDVAGEQTLHQKAKMTMRALIVDGDHFVLPLGNGTLENIEAHRVRTPTNTKKNVVHGVLLDKTRKPIEYWVTNDDISTMHTLKLVGDVRQIKARDADGIKQVFHIKNPKRVSQTRGIGAMAPIGNTIEMHDDIQFAQMVKAKVAGSWGVLEEYAGNQQSPKPGGPRTGEQTTETLGDGTERKIEGLGPGMSYAGPPGAKLSFFTPNVPNPEFFDHAALMLTFVAVNLGIPLAVLLLDPSKTNFSGWRGAIDQARLGFKSLQKLMIDKFYRPIYQWKIRQWLAEDPTFVALAAPHEKTLFKHTFCPPVWKYIEPNKDAQADANIIKSKLNSRRELLSARGYDLDDIDRVTIEDQKNLIVMSITAANEINGTFPDAMVDWREVGGFDLKGALINKANNQQQNLPPSHQDTKNGKNERKDKVNE